MRTELALPSRIMASCPRSKCDSPWNPGCLWQTELNRLPTGEGFIVLTPRRIRAGVLRFVSLLEISEIVQASCSETACQPCTHQLWYQAGTAPWQASIKSKFGRMHPSSDTRQPTRVLVGYSATSKMTSSSIGIPRGRLATPITNRTGIFSLPKTSRNRSETASAIRG
jgi:hypothetical protein